MVGCCDAGSTTCCSPDVVRPEVTRIAWRSGGSGDDRGRVWLRSSCRDRADVLDVIAELEAAPQRTGALGHAVELI